jgi:hypothetical protein
MKLNKTYLPILMALIVSVSSFHTKYNLGRTIGDYSHFAESLFSNNKIQSESNDEYFMNHNPPAKNFVNDLGIFSKDEEKGREFKIKDLMKYVITPENELENISNKGQLSFEIEQENVINEIEKKKKESINKLKVSIPGTNETVKTIKSETMTNSNIIKPVVKTSNLRVSKEQDNKKVVVKKEDNLKNSVLSLKPETLITPKKLEDNKKSSKEELLNDIFSDME